MLRIHLKSMMQSEYMEPSLCSFDIELHDALSHPYETIPDYRTFTPQ